MLCCKNCDQCIEQSEQIVVGLQQADMNYTFWEAIQMPRQTFGQLFTGIFIIYWICNVINKSVILCGHQG